MKRSSGLLATRSHSWREVGLARQLNTKLARRARVEAVILVPLFVGVLLAYTYRRELLGLDTPVRIASVIVLVVLGWAIARDVGRAAGPALFRRLDPGTAGTVGFLIRLVTIATALIVALRIAGLDPRTLAVGGAFTAVIFGLAAQQTLGNLIAGTVLLSARPFRVGDRVRLQGGAIGGQIEGVVSTLGLLYTTLATGEDEVLVPNSVVLNIAIAPLREPDAVNLRARLRPGVTPSDLHELLSQEISVAMREEPSVTLEELDGEEVVVRISATPQLDSDGPQLASEVLRVVARETRSAEDGSAPAAVESPDE
ncbi:MAG TPA: mechanosensitive ion channel family protein [Solirubrobacteraceae bacterium]|jgi:small-conductance mechanosensitive channel|nr:mechanosensitive ion channel family protein [Solirubrobacteraceae bacterium]